MEKWIVLACLTLLAGCATTAMPPLQQVVTLQGGDMIEYVAWDQKDQSGIVSRVVDRFYKNPRTGDLILVTKSEFGSPALLPMFMQGGLAGIAQGLGFWGGMKAFGNSGGSGSGGGATVINQNGQGQFQGQQQENIFKQGFQHHFGNGPS